MLVRIMAMHLVVHTVIGGRRTHTLSIVMLMISSLPIRALSQTLLVRVGEAIPSAALVL